MVFKAPLSALFFILLGVVCMSQEVVIPLSSPAGQRLFAMSETAVFRRLDEFFVPQVKNHCGPDTMAVTMNAFLNETVWTQHSVFTNSTSAIRNETAVYESGMTLPTFGMFLQELHPQKSKFTFYYAHSASLTKDRFRRSLQHFYLTQRPFGFIMINFDRQYLSGQGHGHFSPVGAYNSVKDMALVFDVNANDGHEPFWVSVDALFKAMMSKDPDSGLARGWAQLEPKH